MDEEELERIIEPIISTIAYAFEPICRGGRAAVMGGICESALV